MEDKPKKYQLNPYKWMELVAKDIKDLEALVIKKRQELLKLNVKLLAGKEKNVKLLKNMKKDIVQLLTLKSEKEVIKK